MDDSSRNDDQAGRRLPRRSFLKQSLGVLGAGAALTLLPPGLRSAAWASGSDAVETTKAKLGFIALTDAAPLFVADELG
ncbi:twin-arginine translocation signal domain-containing protein, partial [Pseudomonas oryzihabitans]|uniref:twin-arginine translocation signal domain-containing protein n=1 Tax=Pseudomonas oryzihabitans TaxID=47885 RepID=UPI002896F223